MNNEKCVSFSDISDIPGIIQAGLNASMFLEISKVLENIMDLLISTTDSDTKLEIFYVLF